MRHAPRILAAAGICLATALATLPAASSAASTDGGFATFTAIPADSVVDGYGVGIHLNFFNTPYADADAVAAAVRDLGVRHVRDDLFLDSPAQYAAIQRVFDAGARFDLIMGRPGGTATPADYVRTVADDLPAGSVESLEGVNEWDLFSHSDTWVSEMKDWQHALWEAAKADPATAGLPVLAPALAYKWNYQIAGDMSADQDVANAHMYPGGYRPSNQIGQITQAVRSSIPGGPLITTEAGYHNATRTTAGHLGVPESVAGDYLPRLLLQHVGRGEQRMYSYELIDEFDNPDLTNPEAHFGLLRHDLTPKPAYTAMQNLLGLLADPGPAFTPSALPLAVDGYPPDGRYLLTEKRDGQFVLLLWRDVSLWDPQAQTPEPVTPTDVTLRLQEPEDLSVYRPSSGSGAVSRTTGDSVPLRMDGEVTAVVIGSDTTPPADPEPTAPPAPTELSTVAGDRSADLSWQQPDSDARVSGFEVTRSPGGATYTLGPDDRSLADAGLRNGTGYTYSVRTLAANSTSATVTSSSVVPATVPGRPDVHATSRHRRVQVSWSAARGRGRPVLRYRVTCGDRVRKVASDVRRVTFRHLPRGERLRVTVRARNQIGWGRIGRDRVRVR